MNFKSSFPPRLTSSDRLNVKAREKQAKGERGGGGGGGGERNRLQTTSQHFQNLPFPITCDEHRFEVNS